MPNGAPPKPQISEVLMRNLIATLTLLLPLSAFATKAPALKEIAIGFNPAENADVVETNGKLFAEYYKKATGLDVKTFIATDYTALIEAMRSNRIHFAFLPPFSFVKAEEIAGAQVLMKAVRRGRPYFYSAIITRADKGFHKIEDLKGKNIAWVDPASSSGFVIPKASLKTKKNIDADKFFSRQVFAGSHDALVLSVLNGTVDAGATFVNDPKGDDGAWHQFLKSEEDRKKIRMIFVSDPIPGDTMATTKKFATEHKDIVDKTVKLLAEMGKTEEGKKILQALYRIDAMVPATAKDYQPLRDAAKAIDVSGMK
jgi:phosphonate transport system substrate-binding protein